MKEKHLMSNRTATEVIRESPVTRRRFLQLGLSGMAIIALPVGCGDIASETSTAIKGVNNAEPGRFFDAHQYETIRALTGLIIPEDQDPGAVTACVVDYIDYLLGAFTVDPPRIFAAGPFSGRHGGENNFRVYLPLSRVKEIAWRTYIEGSQGFPEREFNGPVTGLQEIYTTGVEQLDLLAQERFGALFVDLDPSQQTKVQRKADKDFIQTVFNHTVEGMYAAPEYGGNQDLAGWKYIGYEGDRQPIGYSRQQMEQIDSAGTLSRTELEQAAEFVRMVFAPYKDQCL